ncbi:hypothetical protein MJO28_012324 [Puccinia striiformis f. sp. tritici]|uniref:BAG domain-containing protein n=4 Tax=Puccinia striiformis TaxID=27350 RepID=A0A0L0V932_9BASI|nr:hypothetical protein Pst134EA_022787 [Puccinia striiformis f. sp. tritici]KAI9605928.1 hypothetical protein H4Q26_004298 [Puccinia striiformis f. sp. tritici PST-130]KNE95706.1 hypothetical protein PSTG_10925 [Puccinia striiformis f. sp. tritici PST-78]POW04606.1 hypothetical protein PSTT_10242 [Puccinia striiformis]KAH9445819.1 hypothetical protein Pst134EB_023653 [Puccinia striiformis f. sp. tritici]KAH9455316.1 hypothetical protein Pst134EA_022787 [Puccinia striiformis f. sp. tritici]
MEVTWDSERFTVDLPVSSFTLGSFKRYLAMQTGVPTEHMKLFSNAGLMKDDSTPLSAFQPEVDNHLDSGAQTSTPLTRSRLWNGIFSGNKKREVPPMRIRMVGAKETRSVVSDRPDLKPTTPAVNQNVTSQAGSTNLEVMNESRITSLISDLTQKTLGDNILRVERYESMLPTEPSVDQASSDGPLNPQITQKVQAPWDSTEFAGVSEGLLQALLKLDGFEIESEWTEARMARKEGVRAIQKLLDRLDRMKSATSPQR